jgi:hypothetical protein
MSDHTPTIWLDVLAIVMGMIAVAFTSWLAILACGGCLVAADQIAPRTHWDEPALVARRSGHGAAR